MSVALRPLYKTEHEPHGLLSSACLSLLLTAKTASWHCLLRTALDRCAEFVLRSMLKRHEHGCNDLL